MNTLDIERQGLRSTDPSIEALQRFVDDHGRIMVLTGAGISLASGIPTYRDHAGLWQRSDPIQHQQFMDQYYFRQRYWARSMIGWLPVNHAHPNATHLALARWQSSAEPSLIVTQNVDGLHQAAGSQRVCDLHGRLDRVICMDCGCLVPRSKVQTWLEADNAWLLDVAAEMRPDGDADFSGDEIHDLIVPVCADCGGMLKPDVVFFGDNVPKPKVDEAMSELKQSDALWVIGSSLMVYSGFRFVRRAAEWGKTVCILNLGLTRGDDLADLKCSLDCGDALTHLFPALDP